MNAGVDPVLLHGIEFEVRGRVELPRSADEWETIRGEALARVQREVLMLAHDDAAGSAGQPWTFDTVGTWQIVESPKIKYRADAGGMEIMAMLVAACGAGCASMRYEPPPEVAEQPPEATTTEMIEEGAAAEAAAASSREGEGGESDPAAAGQPTAATAAGDAPATASTTTTTDRRYRPTDSSVEQIRSRSAAAAPPLDLRQRVDHAHDRIYVWMQSRVEAMDHGLAGGDGPLEPVPAAPFRLALVGEAIDRDGSVDLGVDANFDIALNLPNIERRLRIFITSAELDEGPRSERESQNLSAGFRYQILRHLDFDLGLRIDKAPVAFAALKWSREVPLGRWDFYPFAKIFAETKESVGYAAAVTFDRWAGRNLFRTSTYAKWRDATPPGFVFSAKASRFCTNRRVLAVVNQPEAQGEYHR